MNMLMMLGTKKKSTTPQDGFKVNQQVIHRRPLSRGVGNMVRTGTILALRDEGTKALVSFEGDGVKSLLPVETLEPVGSSCHGKARVQADPLRRAITIGRFFSK